MIIQSAEQNLNKRKCRRGVTYLIGTQPKRSLVSQDEVLDFPSTKKETHLAEPVSQSN